MGRVRIYGLPQGRRKKIWAAPSTVRAPRRIGLTRQTRKTPSSSPPCIVPLGFLAVLASPAEQNTDPSTRQRPASILTHARGPSGVNRTVPQSKMKRCRCLAGMGLAGPPPLQGVAQSVTSVIGRREGEDSRPSDAMMPQRSATPSSLSTLSSDSLVRRRTKLPSSEKSVTTSVVKFKSTRPIC